MKKVLIIVTVSIIAFAFSSCAAFASSSSDRELAEAWTAENCESAYIETVKTKSKGGYKGKVTGTKYSVRYPKKVKKGKKVTVYMVIQNDEIVAMVCLGIVKE